VRGRGLLPSMLRMSLLASAVAAVVLLVVGWSVSGPSAALAAVSGAGAVVVFSGTTLVVMGLARHLDPPMQLGVAMAVYTTKAGLLFVALPALSRVGDAELRWVGASVVVGVVAWTSGLLVGAVRARQTIYTGTTCDTP